MTEPGLQALDRLFDAEEQARWQPFYDDRARRCPFFVDAPDEHLAQWLDEGRIVRGRALDLGCGHGRHALWLAQQGFEVDAADRSASALRWARERMQAAGVAPRLHEASVFGLALPAAAFDLVVDSGLFHHLPPHRRPGYVARVAGWLKPGGVLALCGFRPEGGNGWTDDEVYARRSLGGGLGFDEAGLRAAWEPALAIELLRPMQALPEGGARFGRGFLWACIARRPLR